MTRLEGSQRFPASVVNADDRLVGLVSGSICSTMLLTDHVHQASETIEGMINTDVPVVGENSRAWRRSCPHQGSCGRRHRQQP